MRISSANPDEKSGRRKLGFLGRKSAGLVGHKKGVADGQLVNIQYRLVCV